MSAEHLAADFAGDAIGVMILIVDDEILARATISDDLRAEGHTVIEAANADEALEILRSQIRIDIVVMDMQMPGSMAGTELVRTIRRHWPNVRIVLMSGHAPDSEVRDLLDAYLPKPFIPSKLAGYVRVLTAEQAGQAVMTSDTSQAVRDPCRCG